MRVYSIFDDFTDEAIRILTDAGMDVAVHPLGVPRPDHGQMKKILEDYDCVIIGTSQKLTEDMFENINTPRIVATASVGLDHIQIPEGKKNIVKVINTPKANAQSVAEYTVACALSCVKRLSEGNTLYRSGKTNKALFRKPEDLAGKTIGVVGAGNISVRIMEYAQFFGMRVLCWTRNPNHHRELETKGVRFTGLDKLCEESDVISVNLPKNPETDSLLSNALIRKMKDSCVFISISRKNVVDLDALLEKGKAQRSFYICLDLDVDEEIVFKIPNRPNIFVTPHIAGGTVETRKRMFREIAEGISKIADSRQADTLLQ